MLYVVCDTTDIFFDAFLLISCHIEKTWIRREAVVADRGKEEAQGLIFSDLNNLAIELIRHCILVMRPLFYNKWICMLAKEALLVIWKY